MLEPAERVLKLRTRLEGSKSSTLMSWDLPSSVKDGDWVPIELRAVGDQITVSANGRKLGSIRNTDVMGSGRLMISGKDAQMREVAYLPLDKPAAPRQRLRRPSPRWLHLPLRHLRTKKFRCPGKWPPLPALSRSFSGTPCSPASLISSSPHPLRVPSDRVSSSPARTRHARRAIQEASGCARQRALRCRCGEAEHWLPRWSRPHHRG